MTTGFIKLCLDSAFIYIILAMNITLPDGSVRKLKSGSSGLDLANDIGPGLAKAAIAVSVNGIQKDLCDPIVEDSKVSIITIDSDEGLEIMRHTLTAQVLARAVKNLYPDAKLAIGPTSLAKSRPLEPDLSSLTLPSGNVIFIASII